MDDFEECKSKKVRIETKQCEGGNMSAVLTVHLPAAPETRCLLEGLKRVFAATGYQMRLTENVEKNEEG